VGRRPEQGRGRLCDCLMSLPCLWVWTCPPAAMPTRWPSVPWHVAHTRGDRATCRAGRQSASPMAHYTPMHGETHTGRQCMPATTPPVIVEAGNREREKRGIYLASKALAMEHVMFDFDRLACDGKTTVVTRCLVLGCQHEHALIIIGDCVCLRFPISKCESNSQGANARGMVESVGWLAEARMWSGCKSSSPAHAAREAGQTENPPRF